MDKSAIIIGGGLGGLFTGAILSKEGLNVTVVEKNATVGGGLQSFTRFGEVFDTGMHVIGGLQRGGNIRRLCDYLGILDEMHVADLDGAFTDELYFAEDGRRYRISKGREQFVEGLAREFPHEREALERYVDAVYRLANEIDLFYLRPSDSHIPVHSSEFMMSADAFVGSYVTDAKLRSVVSYMNPLYSGRGDVTPAYIHAVISALYIDGASRFAGGSYRFAETLSEYICKHGGKVITGDGVTHVHSAGGQISGIETKQGRELQGDYYICAIHPCTFMGLLDDATLLPKAYRTRLYSIPNSYSAFTLNIKLKEGTFRYLNYSGYYMTRYDDVWNFGRQNRTWPLGFLYMTPPEEQQGAYSTKMIITSPMLWDEVRQWEDTTVGHRGADYVAWKQACAEKLLACMEEMYPQFRNCIEDINIASPLTIRDYYGAKEGGMCGFQKDYKNIVLSQVPVVTKVKNLLLTGQNCNLHGFCGVPLTAIQTCEAILGENYVLNKIKEHDIAPFTDDDIPGAMRRIAKSAEFGMLSRYVFPDEDVEVVRNRVANMRTIREFQLGVMYPAQKQVIQRSITEFTCGGMERIDPKACYLYVSNHRDIMLDASLLQIVLTDYGHDTTEITFGANLMKGDLVIDIGKSNKMFRVERPGGSAREFYKASMKLSEYIRHTLLCKRQSVWIAQRNGRTKDGIDATDQGIIKMFAMSGADDLVESLGELNIAPIAVAYEWESCDKLKALELYATRRGPYVKQAGEDLNSILTGILQPKGHVHVEICKPITKAELQAYAHLGLNDLCKQVANLVDQRIRSAYHLTPNNYIACDLLTGTDTYASHYTAAEKEAFVKHASWVKEYSSSHDVDELLEIFLSIYANPVKR